MKINLFLHGENTNWVLLLFIFEGNGREESRSFYRWWNKCVPLKSVHWNNYHTQHKIACHFNLRVHCVATEVKMKMKTSIWHIFSTSKFMIWSVKFFRCFFWFKKKNKQILSSAVDRSKKISFFLGSVSNTGRTDVVSFWFTYTKNVVRVFDVCFASCLHLFSKHFH